MLASTLSLLANQQLHRYLITFRDNVKEEGKSWNILDSGFREAYNGADGDEQMNAKIRGTI